MDVFASFLAIHIKEFNPLGTAATN
jgi:hypothetical protein